MKNIFLIALLTLTLGPIARAQVIYEDFESGAPTLSWTGLNGTFNGAISNPDKSGINTSNFVGSYTNNPNFDFCFALHTFSTPLDISEFNQFKMKIWSPTAPSKALLKLEGPGGPPVEKFVDITVANQWVEYTFDLSAGASYTHLKTILVSFNSFVLGDDKTYYFDDIVAVRAERCYETFEGGSNITWIGLNGTFNGAIANPAPNVVNSTAAVGSFTNNPNFDFNFAFGTIGSGPIDLSVYNQFAIDVWVPQPTSVLFKLEGTGQALEKVKYVPVANAWQRLTFDMSAAASYNTITKILIVFNPGKTGDDKTYYFDNLCAYPNTCVGIVPDLDVIDDFECNRNAAYALGWDSLSVAKNPYPSADNSSAKVGRWNDPAGPGTEWAALVIANPMPIDLSQRTQFSVQVWSPKAGNLLLKLEGGPNPPKEVFVPMEPNKWMTAKADFGDQAGKGHTRWVLFFNAGVNGEPGDVYYFDNVKLSAPSEAVIEDFENGISLGWQPLDQNTALHGTFNGPTPNPNPNSVNNSPNVGCYAKGSSPFSTLQAFSLTPFDLSVFPQFNVDVLSPASGGKVTMQLSSPTQGNKSAEATVITPGQWETLNFDFSAFNNIQDFSEVRFIFNAGTASPGQTWCIDNLRQSKATVDPCIGVVPIPNIIDDFECQRNFVQIFYGASDIKAVNNPHLAPENGSLKVGEYKDPAGPGTEFAGIGYEFAAPPDLSTYNQLQLQIWSPFSNVPFLFKLEDGDTPIEIFDTLKSANRWHRFNIDFSKYIGTKNKKLIIFVNVLSPTGGGTYYIDNVRWARAGYNGCIADYQSPQTSITNFRYFANGSLEQAGYQFEIVDNPNPSGLNTSSKVGKFVKAGDALPFAGMYADLEAPIAWKGNKRVRAKVLMDHIGNFAVKVEGDAVNGAFLEIPVPNTKINAWEELTFDFSAVPDNSEFKRLTIFFDLGINATGQNVTSYFDDIVIGDGACTTVSVWQPLPLEPMKVWPNPAQQWLRVENFDHIVRITITDLMGRRVAEVNTLGDWLTDIDVSQFASGVYQLTGFNAQGLPVGMAKFVKH